MVLYLWFDEPTSWQSMPDNICPRCPHSPTISPRSMHSFDLSGQRSGKSKREDSIQCVALDDIRLKVCEECIAMISLPPESTFLPFVDLPFRILSLPLNSAEQAIASFKPVSQHESVSRDNTTVKTSSSPIRQTSIHSKHPLRSWTSPPLRSEVIH